MRAPRILHQVSAKINSYLLTIFYYYIVIFTVLSIVLHGSGIFTHRESMLETITKSLGIGLMLGLLHRRVLYPKDLSAPKRLFIGTLIVFISAMVIFAFESLGIVGLLLCAALFIFCVIITA